MIIVSIVVLIMTIATMSEDALMGIVVMLVGVLVIMLFCCGLGIIVECAYHLERIEENTSKLLSNGNDCKNEFVQNDKKVENIKIFNDETKVNSRKDVNFNGWICSACGAHNEEYVGTCKCGKSKYTN